ncbi:hypothetical protein AZF37_00950 [endosymbiont 'TC1' of Trimyema compressum]|nr:hypothetical protein AZF37_00950 [endosymbiont 'TC1' of Trimyema compressum]
MDKYNILFLFMQPFIIIFKIKKLIVALKAWNKVAIFKNIRLRGLFIIKGKGEIVICLKNFLS